jgi:hypothetical protein
MASSVGRSLGQREVALHAACLLVLVALVALAPSSPISVLVVLAMLWALGREERRGGERSRSGLTRRREVDRNADDEAHQRLLPCAHLNHHDEEGPWKSDF